MPTFSITSSPSTVSKSTELVTLIPLAPDSAKAVGAVALEVSELPSMFVSREQWRPSSLGIVGRFAGILARWLYFRLKCKAKYFRATYTAASVVAARQAQANSGGEIEKNSVFREG